MLQVGDNLTVHDIDDDRVLLVDDAGEKYELAGETDTVMSDDDAYIVNREQLRRACDYLNDDMQSHRDNARCRWHVDPGKLAAALEYQHAEEVTDEV